MLVMNAIQDHFRCIGPYYKEIQRTNVIIIFPGGVGLLPSMDTRGKQLENHLKCWIFNLKQNLSHIFMVSDTTVFFYTHADTQSHTHTHRHKHGPWQQCISRFCFLCGPAKALEALVIGSTSACVVSKILEHRLSMWRGRYEWCFLKHQSSDDLPKSVLTVDSHWQWNLQSLCAVSIFNFMWFRTSSYFQALGIPKSHC